MQIIVMNNPNYVLVVSDFKFHLTPKMAMIKRIDGNAQLVFIPNHSVITEKLCGHNVQMNPAANHL